MEQYLYPKVNKEELEAKYRRIRELVPKKGESQVEEPKKEEEVKRVCSLPVEPGKRCEACEDN